MRFCYNAGDSANAWIYIHENENTSHGYPVRCMKDDNAVTTVVSVSGVTGITTSSASVNAYVSVDGSRTVSRRGFVCSISSDPVIESGMVVESGEGTGAFSAELTDLASDTKYYVRAFAVVDGETKYSKTSVFTTPNETGVKDLSAAGTANCYIISHAGTYKFKATVKGNGAAFVSNKSDASAKANEENTTINPDNYFENIKFTVVNTVKQFEIVNGEIVNIEKHNIADVFVNGSLVGGINEKVIKDRETLSEEGVVIVNVSYDVRLRKIINEPNIITRGFTYKLSDEQINEIISSITTKIVNNALLKKSFDVEQLKDVLQTEISNQLFRFTKHRPIIITSLVEVNKPKVNK